MNPWSDTWADFVHEWRRATRAGRVRVVVGFVAALARLVVVTLPTGEHPMRNVTQDVRYAIRRLSLSPGFTLVAVLTLAFGIGANTAIFSLVNGMLLTPLPGADTSRVVGITRQQFDNPNTRLSREDVDDLRREGSVVFQHVAVTGNWRGVVTSSTGTEYVIGEVTSHDYFAALGVRPVAGRLFVPDDDRSGVPVAAISERLHRRLFAGDAGAIGQSIRALGMSATIVGIVPDTFHGTYLPAFLQSDVWLPMAAVPRAADTAAARNVPRLLVLATLRSGETEARAQAVLDRAADRIAARTNQTGVRLTIASPRTLVMPAQYDGPGLAIGTAILGLAALVLLIACANLANLFLARGAARSAELAVRLAMGASRLRLLRLLAIEVVMVAGLGSGAGWVIAHAASSASRSIHLPVLEGMQFVPALGSVADMRVFLFIMLVATLAAFVAGWVPAWRASNVAPARVLATGGGGGGSSARTGRLSRNLVAVQVGVCVVLLLGSALFTRSAVASLTHDTGLRTDQGAQVSVDLDLHKFDESAGRRYQARALESVRAIGGVTQAALYDRLPMGPDNNNDRVVAAGAPGGPAAQGRRSRYSHVTGSFFDIVRWPVVRGRVFTDADDAGAPPVVVVNQGLADRLWPGQDPIGKHLTMLDKAVTLEVIGVVANVDTAWPTRDWRARAPDNYLLLSAFQHYRGRMSILVAGSEPATDLIAPLEATVRTVDAGVAVFAPDTLARAAGVWLLPTRISGVVLAALGMAGWGIALIGVYGVVAYLVAQRTREIGVRLALGATRSDIRRMVQRDALRMMLLGVGPGMVVAFGSSFLLRNLLFGVDHYDPVSFGLVPLAVMGVGLLATGAPARRAARVDPNVTLRQL